MRAAMALIRRSSWTMKTGRLGAEISRARGARGTVRRPRAPAVASCRFPLNVLVRRCRRAPFCIRSASATSVKRDAIVRAARERGAGMDGSFVPRDEDHSLLTGAGSFLDDAACVGSAWGVFVRSPYAFADIRRVDTNVALAQPGVLTVLTATDLDAAGVGTVSIPIPVPGCPDMTVPHRPSLAGDCVRHAGEAVALVVAESEAAARDAAELVEVDYAPRDGVADLARAARHDAPRIWPEAPGNLAVDWRPYAVTPEARAELDAIFADAAQVARV